MPRPGLTPPRLVTEGLLHNLVPRLTPRPPGKERWGPWAPAYQAGLVERPRRLTYPFGTRGPLHTWGGSNMIPPRQGPLHTWGGSNMIPPRQGPLHTWGA